MSTSASGDGEHRHDVVAVVVDDLHSDPAGLRHHERPAHCSIQRSPCGFLDVCLERLLQPRIRVIAAGEVAVANEEQFTVVNRCRPSTTRSCRCHCCALRHSWHRRCSQHRENHSGGTPPHRHSPDRRTLTRQGAPRTFFRFGASVDWLVVELSILVTTMIVLWRASSVRIRWWPVATGGACRLVGRSGRTIHRLAA